MSFQRLAKRASVPAAGVLLATWLAGAVPSSAQEQVVWRQTLDLPKGLNLPPEVKADVLGIEIGAGYSDAKARLQALLAEVPQPQRQEMTPTQRFAAERSGADLRPPFTEEASIITMQGPDTSARVEASYIADMRLARELPGSGTAKIREEILVRLSAPSSGHQVLGVDRRLSYDAADEPRVSEITARLAEKFGTQPQVFNRAPGYSEYRFQFNDGAAYVPPQGMLETDCYNYHVINSSNDLPIANRSGVCDVVLIVTAVHGISTDHARELKLILSDNERARQNTQADYDFLSDYIDELAQRFKGVAPKL